MKRLNLKRYERYIYINMTYTSGEEYLACLDTATKWEPGLPRPVPIYLAGRVRFDFVRDCQDGR